MSEIVLRRANVVKKVDSEDKAKALEAKGFIRDGAKAAVTDLKAENAELKKSLVEAGKVIDQGDDRSGELEEELADAKAKLGDAEKKIEDLTNELTGTKEQLEAALKKNKEMAKANK